MGDVYTKSILFYQYSNGFPNEAKFFDDLLEYFKLNDKCPLLYIGILYDLKNDIEFSYYDRSVSDEVCTLLSNLFLNDIAKFYTGFTSGLSKYFLANDSYFLVRERREELSNVSFENNTKSSIYRIPTYISICESVLMNYYRFFASILSSIKDSDYIGQNTLGKVIPVLKKYGFVKSTEIDVSIRNSINHGSVVLNDTELIFAFHDSGKDDTKTATIWEFDDLIKKCYDIASGIFIGIIKFLSFYPNIVTDELATIATSINKSNWFRLLYHSKNIQCININEKKSKGQVNLLIKTKIQDTIKLQIALRLLLEGLYIFFNENEQFMVSYQHPRSVVGFIRMGKTDLEKFIAYNGGETPSFSGQQIYMIPSLQSESIDIRRYNYFTFPEIKGTDWYIEKLEICSIEQAKRIKGRLILTRKLKKEAINKIIESVLNTVKTIELPENPKHKVVFGKQELGALFLDVFLQPTTRNEFNLFANNQSFVCLAHYYYDNSIPKLAHGGIPVFLWNSYKKDRVNNIEYRWNRKYRAET